MSKIAVIGIAAAALAAAFAFSGGAHAAVKPPGGDVPDNVRDMIQRALDTADPEVIRVTAAKVRALGYNEQAESMKAAANEIETDMKRVQSTQPGKASPGITSGKVITGTPIKTAEDQQARSFAGSVAAMLSGKTKGREDRLMVKKYQEQETKRGQAVGKIDGFYGIKTALTLANDHGIAPPKPLYFSSNATERNAAIAFYKSELMKFAAADPARREEWTQAANAL